MVKAPSTRRSAASVSIGRRLRSLRQQRVLTQAQVAERAGLDVNYISQIERGRRDPSLSSLSALAKAFGLSLADLFAEDAAAKSPIADALREIEVELKGAPESLVREVVVVVRAMRRAVNGE